MNLKDQSFKQVFNKNNKKNESKNSSKGSKPANNIGFQRTHMLTQNKGGGK